MSSLRNFSFLLFALAVYGQDLCVPALVNPPITQLGMAQKWVPYL